MKHLLSLLHQGLDKYHTGMYWYTSRDSVEEAFELARQSISKDLNVLEFHKVIAPLVALSNEDHTDIYLNERMHLMWTQHLKAKRLSRSMVKAQNRLPVKLETSSHLMDTSNK